jgi:hypothetical protein|tara:strand:- start:22523 stop:23809 length:1287 start_codon:yes stop_codon:yes gene_type:complete
MRSITIEECLEAMAGLTVNATVTPAFIVLDRDKKIIFDIAKKVFKGSALTDRQLEAVKKILITRYKSQFKIRGIDLENSVNNLRQPLRHLDRTEYMRLEEGSKYLEPFWSGFTPQKVIVTRFPFNMTYSKTITEVKKLLGPTISRYYSQKLKDKYILPYTEKVTHRLLTKFKNKIKDIDPVLLDVYDQCEKIYKKSDQYVPGIYNYQIKNSSETVTKYHQEYFGDPVKENLYLYYDRKEKLGLKHFDQKELAQSTHSLSALSKAILERQWPRINLDLKKWPMEQVIETITELRRFPLLVIISGSTEKECLADLHSTHKLFKNIIPNNEIAVMARCKNSTTFGKEFNDYIKDNQLNNSLAKSTKIVYITSKKIPKPLLTSEWESEAVLICDNTRNYSKVDKYVGTIDLQLQINGQDSFWSQVHFGADTV